MEQQPPIYRFMWQGIEIEASYWPLKWCVIAHLEIRSIVPERAPLPITETGYLSHFHARGTVEANGGDVVAEVVAWLDEEAEKPAWQAYRAAKQAGRVNYFEAERESDSLRSPASQRQRRWRKEKNGKSSIICAQKAHRQLLSFFLHTFQ